MDVRGCPDPEATRSARQGAERSVRVLVFEGRESAVYAIVRSGASQQKVSVGDVIEIDKVAQESGDSITLPVVLLVDGDTVTSDAKKLAKASVTAEVLGATKGPKVTILKYKNKTGYRKRMGHRQKYTQVKVTGISAK